MPNQSLAHRQIHGAIAALADAKILNLDASIKSMLEPLAEAMVKTNVGDDVSIHVLCCNEYALVTGLTASPIDEIRQLSETIRATAGQLQQR
jgi:hypothetical protein